MPYAVLLAYYCLFILLASIIGGMIPVWVHLTHRWMECAVSFVAGVMLGVAMFHLLPHALGTAAAARATEGAVPRVADVVDAAYGVFAWLLLGFLAMFFIERFLCYHHHDVPQEASHRRHVPSAHGVPASDEHDHDVTWGGAAIGLAVHSILEGVALSASVWHGGHGSALAGFGTFLVILLHKPLDAMTITMLMARGGWSPLWRSAVNGLFALAIPAGIAVFHASVLIGGSSPGASAPSATVAYALAFSAGMFLCISMSDLLPELQFHQHDRVKLSAALLLGLLVAYLAGRLEAVVAGGHQHDRQQPATADSGVSRPHSHVALSSVPIPGEDPIDDPPFQPTAIGIVAPGGDITKMAARPRDYHLHGRTMSTSL